MRNFFAKRPFEPVTGATYQRFGPSEMDQGPREPLVECVTFRRFGPSEEPTTEMFQPGDFILTHGNAFFSKLIRFGQCLRYHGKDRKYIWWNHAALIVSQKGELVEALGVGVRKRNISEYKETEYHLVHLEPGLADARDRDQTVQFAMWCLGEPYAWATIVSIALSLIFGGKFNFGFDGQTICSGLVARALERTRVIFNKTPSHIMPADLAKYFGVEPPPIGTSKGRTPHVRQAKGRN